MINIINEYKALKEFVQQHSKLAVAIVCLFLGFSSAVGLIDTFVLPMKEWIKRDTDQTRKPPNCSNEIMKVQELTSNMNLLQNTLQKAQSDIAIEKSKNASCTRDLSKLQELSQSESTQRKQEQRKLKEIEEELRKSKDPYSKCLNRVIIVEKNTAVTVQGLTIVFHGTTGDGRGTFTLQNKRLKFHSAIYDNSIKEEVSIGDIINYVDYDNLSCSSTLNEVKADFSVWTFSDRQK